MAVLADFIGAGIVAVLKHADFVTSEALFPAAAVGYGLTWEKTLSYEKYGRCLVRLTGQTPVEGRSYDDSAQTEMALEIRVDVNQIDGAQTKWSAFLATLIKHFGDNGVELYAAVLTANSGNVPATLKGGGLVVTIGQPFGVIPGQSDDFEEHRDRVDARIPLTVKLWHTT